MNRTGALFAFLIAANLLTSPLFAQAEAILAPLPPPVADASAPYIPLTLSQSYLWTLNQTFGAPALLRIATSASIDQYEKDPASWPSSTGGYIHRFASRIGRTAVAENVAFGVRALDREDPQYLHSGKTSFWKRVGYATGHTFAARNQHGALMPAYSTFIGEFSAPFVSDQWRPNGVVVGRELASGSLGVGLTVVQNLALEFWPDVKKAFRR